MSDRRGKSGKNNTGTDAPVKEYMWRYPYRSLCGLIITAVYSLMFFFVWYRFARENNQTGHLLGTGNLLMAYLIYVTALVIFFIWMRGFKIGVYRKSNTFASQLSALFIADFLEIFISMAITGQFRFFWSFVWRYLLLFLVQSLVDLAMVNIMVNIYRKLFPPLQMLEIYGNYTGSADYLYEKMMGTPNKYHVARRVNVTEGEKKILPLIDRYDAVVINDLPDEDERYILKACFSKNVRVYFTPKISDIIIKSSDYLNLFDTPLYLNRNMGLRMSQRAFKRFFDFLFAILGLAVTSPIFLVVAVAIKKEDGGSVFFRQKRVTIDGKIFNIIKFRSMRENSDKAGEVHPAEDDDARITRVGRVIRRSRIDELPQLINILKGDMSIVGPRPERVEHVMLYSEKIPEFRLREKVKGGLTGYAQVYGKYNTTALDKLKMDLIYIMNYSPLLDLQIIFETFRVLFVKDSTEGFTKEQIDDMHD